VYGAAAGAAGGQLADICAAMLALQPRLRQELAAVGAAIAQNAAQVVEACGAAAQAAFKDPAALRDLLDGVLYLRDTCLTLCALVRTLPLAAGILLLRGPALIEALGGVHDQLIPAAERAAAAAGAGAGGGRDPDRALLRRRCLHVEVACERAVQLLIVHGLLEPGGPEPPTGGGGGSGAAAAAVTRGEALVAAVMLLGHREGEPQGGAAPPEGGMSLGPALAQRLGVAASVQAAQRAGAISLDDAQADYLAALMGLSSLGAGPVLIPGLHASGDGGGGGGGGGDGDGAAGGSGSAAGGGGGGGSAAELAAVAQVRELLPDFGEGFVAACLRAVGGGGVEAALNALLEGAVPPGVEHLDRALTYQQFQQQQAASRPGNAAGQPAAGPGPAAGSAAAPAARGTAGRGKARRPEGMTALYLDTKEDRYRGSVLAAATDTQWEYDDEYDDSFDETMHLGADGLAEAEGQEQAENGAGAGLERGMRGLAVQPGAAAFAPGGAGRGGRGGAGRGGRGQQAKGKLWVLDGRVYNYAKPGAAEAGSAVEAEARVQEAQHAALQIHGLGPGGNVPLQPSPAPAAGQGPGGGEGGGGGRGRGGREGGRGGRGGGDSHGWKDKNKAAVGNHHRKDRAAQKQARGMQ
jgi:activating signal cointegrator complex subunit 2